MKRRNFLLLFTAFTLPIMTACENPEDSGEREVSVAPTDTKEPSEPTDERITEGTETYRNFVIDNVYRSETQGDIHYNVYIPESYDGSEAYAIYFTLPGWQGLYFQGVAANLQTEDYGIEAQNYNEKMIVVAPQLDDWGETSANQTIALVEFFLENYNVDPSQVFANGLSGGGETMSLVMGKRPELFTAYLHCAAQWNGDNEALANSRTPVYFAIGENDEYYGSQSVKEAYSELYALYREQGLTDDEISELVVLDIKEQLYFSQRGFQNQHAGSLLFAHDEEIMGWLFDRNL